MSKHCMFCHAEISIHPLTPTRTITNSICDNCFHQMSSPASSKKILESIDVPVLLMQGNPRQVITANNKALELFAKDLSEVEGHRGGQVFDCVHSFSEAGCGKDINCENCVIKNAIVDTFISATPHEGVSTTLQIKNSDGLKPHVLQVSTEKIGEFALVTVDRFERT